MDLMRSGVKTINSLPVPEVEDKIGTEKHNKYVESVLLFLLYDVFETYGIVAKDSPNLLAQLTQDFGLKSLRLAAEIAIEINRPDVELDHKVPKKTAQKDQ